MALQMELQSTGNTGPPVDQTSLLPARNDVHQETSTEVKIEDGRDSWGHKAEFLLASIGLAVGLGNVWRFPYLCQKNGGGAFLIPYFIMMVIEGIPLFYIEFAIGQRFRRSAVGCFQKIHPALMGVGIGCMVISCLLCIYYISVIAWCIYYLFVSFTTKLPWSVESCPRYDLYKNYTSVCAAANGTGNMKECVKNISDCCIHDPQLHYFYRTALNISPSIGDLGGGINWKLFGCLILAWIVVYLCIVKGVKSSGKAVYFTATFPYLVLFVLFIVGVTLPGAGEGIKTLFYPKFEKLLDSQIWMDAATQMFFTLSLGFGALISFASYMPIKNDCVRDAYTVVLVNCGTSIFAGIVVFSILGHRAHILGEPLLEIGSGPGLAFITFCDAFLQMPISPLWSILFFIMLILLGIDSEFGTLEGAIAPLYDMKWVTMRKEIFTGIVVLVMLVLGLALTCSSGFYAFQMFDDFSVSLGLLFIAFFQTVAVSWVYGNDKFADDIEFMTGKRPYLCWMLCFKYISPIAILIIFLANCYKLAKENPTYKAFVGCKQQEVDFSPISKGVDGSMAPAHYPGWGQFIIFIFITASMIPIIIFLVKDLVMNPSKWVEGFKKRLGSLIEYHPDPYRVDKTRRKSPQELEIQIFKEAEMGGE